MEADVCIDHLPVSSSSESVNIREFDDTVINPDPVIRNEDTEQLMEDYLSPQKLVKSSSQWGTPLSASDHNHAMIRHKYSWVSYDVINFSGGQL